MTQQVSASDSKGGERAGTLTARAIADLVGGELRGEELTEVSSIAPLMRARNDQITFFGDARYAAAFAESRAGIVLVTPDLAASEGRVPSRIIVEKPQAALLELIPRFYPSETRTPAIDPTARIGRGARVGTGVSLDAYAVIGAGAVIKDGAWIGAHSVIGDGVTIGERAKIFPNVTVYAGSVIHDRVSLHSGVVVGSDGFGYVFADGQHRKIPHVGRCIIENDVEIGANTTIDRGSIDDTIIGAGTKIDNLVQIGHNVKVGKLCLIMAQVGIAGSTSIGDGSVLAGQAGLGGHITIGAGARIGGQAGVFGSVPPGETWSGYPARPHRESLRATGALFKLADIIKDLEKLIERQRQK